MSKQVFCFDWDGVIYNSLPIFWKIYNQKVSEINLVDFKRIVSDRVIGSRIIPGKLSDYESDFLKGEIFPEIKKLLKLVKENNKTLIIISTSKSQTIKTILAQNEMIFLVDEVYGSEYQYNKPNKGIWSEIKDRYSVKESDIIYVGDELVDSEFVKDTHIDTIYVTYGFTDDDKFKNHLDAFNYEHMKCNSPKELNRKLSNYL